MSTATATGIHHRSYAAELRLRHTRPSCWLGLMVALLLLAPSILDNYWLSIANTILIAVIGAVGLNILVGFTGQISLGQGGFLAVGAYTSAILSERSGRRFRSASRSPWSSPPRSERSSGCQPGSRASALRSPRWRRRRSSCSSSGGGVPHGGPGLHRGLPPQRPRLRDRAEHLRAAVVLAPARDHHRGRLHRPQPLPDDGRPQLHGGPRPGHCRRGHRRQHHTGKGHRLRRVERLRRPRRRPHRPLHRDRDVGALHARCPSSTWR